MSQRNKHWKSYVTVEIISTETGDNILQDVGGRMICEPIQRWMWNPTAPKVVTDSLNQENTGKIHKFHRYTWELTLVSTSQALPKLLRYLKTNTDFQIQVTETGDESVGRTPDGWTLKNVILSDCSVVDLSEVHVVNDAAVITVRGIALSIQATDDATNTSI